MTIASERSGEPGESGQETWAAVDGYFHSALFAGDSAMAEAERSSEAAGLPAISVSAAQGKLLHLLVRGLGARRILEVGTLGGHSTIWMAKAIAPSGRLITFELDPRHAEVARTNLDRAGVGDLVDIRIGPAAENLQALLDEHPKPFDFVFIDADKASNSVYLNYAVLLGRPGTVIVVDNVVRGGRVLSSTDQGAAGIRQLVAMLATRADIDSVAIQTVGVRGYDGFILAVVKRPD